LWGIQAFEHLGPNQNAVNFELEKAQFRALSSIIWGRGCAVAAEEGLGYNRQTIFTEDMATGTYLVRVVTHEGETHHERIVLN
jgi:hypothetical protein